MKREQFGDVARAASPKPGMANIGSVNQTSLCGGNRTLAFNAKSKKLGGAPKPGGSAAA
jgi:hypothetical protein